MKKFTLITAAIACLALASAQAAKPEGKPAGGRHAPMLEQLLPPPLVEKLTLTGDQKAKYDELSAAFKKDADAWVAKYNYDPAKAREEMKKAHEAKDKATMEKFKSQRMELANARKNYVEQFKATLTDEQKKTMDDAKENFKKHHGEKHGGKDKPAPAPEQ